MITIVGIDGIPEVVKNLEEWKKRTINRAYEIGKTKIAPMALNYARTNAPWTDRTGKARAGLKTSTKKYTAKVSVKLFHTVDYGVYLEKANSGRYAILLPTLVAISNNVVEEWKNALKVGGSGI